MKKDARLSLRITSELKASLEEAARHRRRTVNWLAQDILENWVAADQKRRAKRRKS